jgi:hypothetical protein
MSRFFSTAVRGESGTFLKALSQNCKNRLLDSLRLYVCPSAWNNSAPTGRILISELVSKFCQKKIKLLLKSDKSNEHFILRRFDIYDNILLNSSYNEKCFKQICRENQTTNFTFRTFFS